MNISKRKQGILAIICTIAMIVTSITVYNPREVKADTDYSKLTYNYKNKGEAYMKGSETTKSPWRVAIDESQSKGDIVNWMTTGAGSLNFYNDMFMNVTWHGNYPDATLEINGVKVENGGVGVQVFVPVEIHVNAKEWINNNAYNVVKVTSADETQYVTFIVATGDKAGTSSEETTVVQKPSAPEGLAANINDLKTNYTIAFAPVSGATSYKFYLNGKYIKDITNGGPNGIVTIEELGLKAGETYQFGVSAVNAAGESDITTIDVTAPGREEGTTTPNPETDERTGNIVQGKIWKAYTYAEDSKGLYEISSDATNYTLKDKNIGSTWWHIQTAIDGVTFYANTDYVCTFTLKADKPKEFTVDNRTSDGKIFVESEGKGWQKAEDGTYFYKYKGTFASTTKQDLNVRIALGYHNGKDEKTDSNYSANDIATFEMSNFQIVKASEYKDVTYTVSIDGKEETYEKGDSISVPTEGQGYYDVTKKVAYAPGTVLTVNENMTLKSIELNVTMTPGASIRLAAPTGLRFQTTVTSGNDIAVDDILDLTTGTVTTGTLITTRRLYEANDNTLTKDSDYNFLDIENDGWFNDGTKTTTGKFCGSIVRIKAGNYDREFIAVGYATINYSNSDPKTVYAEVTVNNAKSIQYVANKVQASEKFSGYTAKQKAIINKYIDGKEISE